MHCKVAAHFVLDLSVAMALISVSGIIISASVPVEAQTAR